MALNDLVSSMVAVGDRIAKSLEVSVTYEAWVSNAGAFGAPQFAAPVVYSAIVDDRLQNVMLDGGQVITIHAVITILQPFPANGATGRREPVDPRDRFTLPSGYTGPIKNVDGGLDNPSTSKPYFVQVFLG